MKRLLVLCVSVALLLVLLTAMVSADDFDEIASWYKLIAGQTEHVGDIRVSIEDGDLHVRFIAFSGYCLQETHVHVASTLAGIPQTNGGPVPGQFASKHEELGCVTYDHHVFEGPWEYGTQLYIAAHASVGKPDDPYWEETGWGVPCGQIDAFQFPGSNWAAYILHTVLWAQD